jgi:hypothetical protein
MRLNGWLRIGIVASVLWILIGGFFINGAVSDSLGAPALEQLHRCVTGPDSEWGRCSGDFDRAYDKAQRGHWPATAVYTFVPLGLAWVGAFGALAIFRWVRRGFDPQAAR